MAVFLKDPKRRQPQQVAEKRCRPWFDKLTMRAKPLITRNLILSLSKDGTSVRLFFSILLEQPVDPA
jgi:hypothetical protein